jgi:hypothetical protein
MPCKRCCLLLHRALYAGLEIAATSAVGQAHINVSGLMAGRILSGQVLQDGDEVPSLGNWMRVAEPEQLPLSCNPI